MSAASHAHRTRSLPFPAWSVATAAIGGLLVSCTAQADPEPVAEALATALQERDLGAVAFADASGSQAQDDLERLVAAMDPAQAVVTVGEVAVDDVAADGSATVDLQWSWDPDGPGPQTETWDYTSEATLLPADEDEAGWSVRWSPDIVHPDATLDDRLVLVRRQPDRADVLGADGRALVTERPVERVGIDRAWAAAAGVDGDDALAQAAAEVAAAVQVDEDSYIERVLAAGDQAFVEAIVLRRADASAVREQLADVPGARSIADELPLAPTRDFARPLLGSVGPATAEIVESSDGAVAGTDVVGLSGLQARYDEQLRGVPGVEVALEGDEAAARQVLYTVDPAPGTPVTTTLDQALQQRADDLLASVGPPSALVALRPGTGEVLAVASGPGGDGYSTATLGQYAPGSVFKLVTALALLRDGATPGTTLPCTDQVNIDGKVFTNYSDYPPSRLGDISLAEAVAQSCNTAFVSQVDRVDLPSLRSAAESLGIGSSDDVGVDAFVGQVGEPDGRIEAAATLIGQGSVLMSPLGVATMAASAAGSTVTPVLVGETAVESDAPALAESPDLMTMMQRAVTSGTATILADVPGPPVAAKTGTAEFGTADPPDTHGWMLAVQDDLAVAVFVEEAESGSATAGPILRDFLSGS
jgi:cell division protein FtsI/penicillin-binding protein 2